jgi:hypothetical protein
MSRIPAFLMPEFRAKTYGAWATGTYHDASLLLLLTNFEQAFLALPSHFLTENKLQTP